MSTVVRGGAQSSSAGRTTSADVLPNSNWLSMPDCGRGPIESQFNTEQFSGAPGIFAGEVTQVTLQRVNGQNRPFAERRPNGRFLIRKRPLRVAPMNGRFWPIPAVRQSERLRSGLGVLVPSKSTAFGWTAVIECQLFGDRSKTRDPSSGRVVWLSRRGAPVIRLPRLSPTDPGSEWRDQGAYPTFPR